MHRRTCAIISSLLLLGCVNPPKKPQVLMGSLDLPRAEVIEGLTGGDTSWRVPLVEYDKAVCFRLSSWEQVQVYIQLLEDYAKKNCR